MVGEARSPHRGHAVSFAELNGLMDGCPACRTRHTAGDVLAFFKIIDRSVPRSQDVHVVLDNLSPQGTGDSRLACTPTTSPLTPARDPTSSSWLNLVQRWFKELTGRRGVGAPSPACPPSSKPSRRGSPAATRTQSHSSAAPQPAKPPREPAEDEDPCHKSDQPRSTRARTGRSGQQH
jgi:hypothetical protein